MGDDTMFDKLLEELGIAKNRQYASGKWTEFKAARGIVPPPKFVCEASEFETVAGNVKNSTSVAVFPKRKNDKSNESKSHRD
jgi:hypothetical protein